MTVSIIIAVKTWQKNLEECVNRCLELADGDFEIIVLPDRALTQRFDARVRVIPTGDVTPPHKRDIGIKEAKGAIIAFLDDDAYPCKEWLRYAREDFRDEGVAAVGGPAVTAPSDPPREKASGLVYSSALVSARFAYRYVAGKRRTVEDYPSCNLLVRKDALDKLGGFQTSFWPGEDTKLCLDITRGLHKKIVYDPRVLVYHHRRPLFKGHLKQIANYALHRGYFVKKYPATSLKPAYFTPSIFLVLLTAGALWVFFFDQFNILYASMLLVYLLATLAGACAVSRAEKGLIPLVWQGIILTHLTYGFFFIKGLSLPRLSEEP
ncbi:MAG: glycosyltransferase [Candidatus Omnitrophica bacterium]|nr:glycosyltransferase [Candidatus Omnitrophota bacterium]